MQSPAHSQLASMNTFSLAAAIVSGAILLPVDGKTISLAEQVLLTGEELSIYEWKYRTDNEDIERVRKASAGLRLARGDVENEF
mgnify:CR=1 FL=1